MSLALQQLNSGGLKLKSNFSAKSVAANITANRGAAAAMVKGGYNNFGSNLLFTPARRMGGAPRYMSGSQLSRALNGQNMRFVSGGGIPAYSGASYAQNVTMGTSNAFNNGMGLGATLNLALQLAGGLKELGLFGSKEAKPTPQGAGTRLNDAIGNTLGNTATTVISGNADIQNLVSAMQTASTQDSAALRGAITNAKAQLGTMENTKTSLQADVNEAQNKMGEAKTNFQKAGEGVASAKGKLSIATRDKDAATLARNDAITAFADSKAAKGTAKNEYYKAVGNTSAAEHDVSTATTRHNDAKAAVSSAQGKLDQANSRPEGTAEQKAAKQSAIAQATAELNAAKAKEEAAKAALDQANAALEKAKTAENAAKEKLSDAEKNEINAETAKNEATTALTDANKKVDTANDNLTEANSNVKIAENKEKDAKAYFDKLNGAAGKLNAHLKEMQTLQDAITKYEGKLADLEAKENQKLQTNNEENQMLDGKYDFTDNRTSRSERKAAATIASNNEENVRLSTLSDQSFVAQQINEHPTGVFKAENPHTGHTMYFNNGQQITENEYNNQIRTTRHSQNQDDPMNRLAGRFNPGNVT